MFSQRIREADEFYAQRAHVGAGDDARLVQRQAFAGLLWGKQSYHYDVSRWLRGDSTQPTPPAERYEGRNHDGSHLHNSDVISMPDKWEYPWYAAWDLGVSLRRNGADRSGVCEGPADPVPARMVHASERATARVRMEFFGRQSAGARVGGMARLQNCGPDSGARRTGSFWCAFFTSCF